ESDNLTTADLEAHIIERTERAVPLGKAARVDHHVGRHPTSEQAEKKTTIAGKCPALREDARRARNELPTGFLPVAQVPWAENPTNPCKRAAPAISRHVNSSDWSVNGLERP